MRDDAHIGILVNNAGINDVRGFVNQSADDVAAVTALNARALGRPSDNVIRGDPTLRSLVVPANSTIHRAP